MVNLEHVDLLDAIQNPHYGLLVITGCILMLALAVLVLRYASYKYPSIRPYVTEVTDINDTDNTEEIS